MELAIVVAACGVAYITTCDGGSETLRLVRHEVDLLAVQLIGWKMRA